MDDTTSKALMNLPRFMDRMARVVKDYGERTALTDGMRSLTYAELDEESGKVYHWLKRHGVGKESFILVSTSRSVGFFSCAGGVLRAGAAFVPMENTYPAERIEFIRKDASCAYVLDDELYQEIIATEEYLGGYEETDRHDACFAVYTSGSTGSPKGVLHEYGTLDLRALAAPERDFLPESPRGMMEHFYFAANVVFESTNLLSAATIHIIGREVVANVGLLTNFIERNRIEGVFMPPSYVRAYRRPSSHLKEIIVAGEPANKLYYPGGEPALHNMYGLTESSCIVLDMILDRAYDVAPVGCPTIDLLDLHLEDEQGERVEGPGEGEVCYTHPFFRGYINLPEKTAEVVRDGVFHTGDLARRDERGLYYIRGRKDDMFKVNGNRIEPAEIERRVSEVTGLGQVVAKGFQEGSRAFVCAYFLRGEAEGLGIWDGQRLTCDLGPIRRLLPDYMIPAHYVALDEFPHNANGKLAKIELEAPELEAPGRGYVAPASERERLFCDLMAEVLELDRVGATDDFYELGGDSMGAAVLLSSCSDEGYDISISMLYKNRTPRALAQAIGRGGEDAKRFGEQALEAFREPQPVLANQMEKVRQFVDDPDAVMHNIAQMWQLKEGTDLERLRAALDKVFRAHPALLTRFEEVGDALYQRYDEGLFKPTEIIACSDDEFAARKGALVVPHRGLEEAPARRAIYHTDSADYLFFDIHHSVADGTSMVLLREQVYACYRDPAYQIPEDGYYYFVEQMARAERDCSSAAHAEAEDFYQRRFEREGNMAACSCVLRPDLTGASEPKPAILAGRGEFSRPANGSPSLFLTATAVAVAKLNHESCALVYATYHGRDTQAKRHSVGMFASTIPVYLSLNRTPDPSGVIADVRKQLDFGMAHCTYPFQRLHPTPHGNTVLFNYQKDTMDMGSIAAIVEKQVRMPQGQNGMVVTGLIDRRDAERLTWYCGYDASHYSTERMEAFHKEFGRAVAWLQ